MLNKLQRSMRVGPRAIIISVCQRAGYKGKNLQDGNLTLTPSSRKFIKQCLCIFQICCVKAFREPAENFRKKFPRLVPLALSLPQATQAHRRAQFRDLALWRRATVNAF